MGGGSVSQDELPPPLLSLEYLLLRDEGVELCVSRDIREKSDGDPCELIGLMLDEDGLDELHRGRALQDERLYLLDVREIREETEQRFLLKLVTGEEEIAELRDKLAEVQKALKEFNVALIVAEISEERVQREPQLSVLLLRSYQRSEEQVGDLRHQHLVLLEHPSRGRSASLQPSPHCLLKEAFVLQQVVHDIEDVSETRDICGLVE